METWEVFYARNQALAARSFTPLSLQKQSFFLVLKAQQEICDSTEINRCCTRFELPSKKYF
jgi:hypothetical protein